MAKAVSETPSFQCENQANGESIAQRSQRPQRGIGIGGESCLVNAGLPVREPGDRAPGFCSGSDSAPSSGLKRTEFPVSDFPV